ncbi:MAG: 50S ribosomal protein L13 [Candidatus Magasanikbacteria bacterium]|nr:50S ribosomal protein L13 [Candidatus Magasanikbacteria bacterium]
MKKQIKRQKHELDATDRAVGRLASEAAKYLMGKNKPDYSPNIDGGDFVTIINASKLKFTGKKLEQKDYYHHTLFPGGLKKTSMKKVFEKNPEDVIRRAVRSMLPKNKLRNEMLKRLNIKA